MHKLKNTFFSLFLVTFFLYDAASQTPTFSKPHAAPRYVTPKYTELPLGAIKPNGWLLHQLQIMRDGTTGHLDEVYAKVKNDNGWLGGRGDSWEETPYWLDGAVPLAYLLDDPTLKEKVVRYINWTLDSQRPSGYFGARTKWEQETGKSITLENCDKGDDWWPKMIMLKVLQQYYLATGDKRVVPFMSRYFKYQLQALKTCPINRWSEWAEARGADNSLMAQWLYGITKEPSLLSLSALVQKQSLPWSRFFEGRDWVINAAAQQNNVAWMTRHGVNVGMGVKDPVVQYQRTGDAAYLKIAKRGFTDLMTLHGLPYGMFSADEDLHGNDPVQGTELCAIVETMFSLEQMIALTGDLDYMEALERMTFNALPTQTTDDYNNKQYFQIANQVQIKRGVFQFSLPFEREMNNVLGMRSGYTCCLANLHQGWTKFASHLWYGAPGNGVAALHYSPNEVTATVGAAKTKVIIAESTSYPFDNNIQFHLKMEQAVSFPFQLRIPAWCREATMLLNGKKLRAERGGQIVTINRTWQNGDSLTLQLPMEIKTTNWGGNSRTVERGPLVYALKLDEIWEKGTDKAEGDYFSVYPKSAWNYGLLDSMIKHPGTGMQATIVKPASESFVWNLAHAPIEIKALGRKIPSWQLVNDVAPQPVTARDGLFMGATSDTVETLTLVPYGCTKVRIVAFPVVR
ncbi:MAG TPA: beta-L-arabinofuranosidase domain-containing protein [Chitinophagaceae bacterium]|nr:beta-L-arabinofuranosidase domain-containing protein [Chitinophagaceae bacterium]